MAGTLAPFKGHRMAKAALEMGVLDAELRSAGRSFAQELGAVHERVPCGVSVGIMDSVPALLDAVGGYLAEGYVRIKLKIEPGWDVEPVRAVRERFGDEVLLQVDANTAYTLADARHLARLDPFDLLLIEQPLDEEDVLGHADLARLIKTPVCLDESIVSAQSAAAAIRLGACQIVNIKPGRVGGYLEARRIHDLCVAHGVPVWCGGMLETGLGRAANVALAALPGFTLPGDTRDRGGSTAPTSRHRSCSTTATCASRPGRGLGSRRSPRSSPRSPRERSGSRSDAGLRPSGRRWRRTCARSPETKVSRVKDQAASGSATPATRRISGNASGGRSSMSVSDDLPPGRHPTLEGDRQRGQRDRLHRTVGVLGASPARVNASRATSNDAAARGPWTGRRWSAVNAPGCVVAMVPIAVKKLRTHSSQGTGEVGSFASSIRRSMIPSVTASRVGTWLYNDVTCTPSSAAMRRRVTPSNPSRSAMATAAVMMRSRVSGGTAEAYRLLTPRPTV